MIWVLLVHIVSVAADLPTLDYDVQWGLTNETWGVKQPFNITFEDDMISDLRMRLSNYRRPSNTFANVNYTYGTNTNDLESWVDYWAEDYDFEQRALELNKYPHYKVLVQGLKIHCMIVEPENTTKETVTLLLLHGWPGSIREFYDVIPRLIADNDTRDFSVRVVIPSLPGFGFSDAAVIPGMGPVEMAVVFRSLMSILGYECFYIQGGDWGSYIGSVIATLFPEEVCGFHTNLPMAATSEAIMMMAVGAYLPDLIVDSSLANRMYPMKDKLLWLLKETGYFHYQATKPDTLGVALTDSPVGLLSYFLTSFSSGTRKNNTNKYDGGVLDYFTRDQILDNIMMYWVDNKVTTSFRIYFESIQSEYGTQISAYPTKVPVWALQAPDDIIYMSPVMLRTKFTNLLYATTLEEGGHYLALERPEVFAEDVLQALEAFRKWHESNAK